MDALLGRPGDRRNFVHKKIFGGLKGAVSGFISGGPTGALGGAVKGFAGGGRRDPVFTQPTRSFTPRGFASCEPGFFRDSTGRCVPLETRGTPIPGQGRERFFAGGRTGRFEFGDAVLGQFGAALEPAVRPSDVLVCPRGTVLGLDNLCYNKKDLKNSERKWPRGRRPLLTGGEMRCISIASRAAQKLQRKQKQLIELGMLKAPARRSKQKALPSGHHAHVEHN